MFLESSGSVAVLQRDPFGIKQPQGRQGKQPGSYWSLGVLTTGENPQELEIKEEVLALPSVSLL